MPNHEQSLPRKGRVLILDDELPWRKELTHLLQNKGYDAYAVATVQEVLAALKQDLYHVLILDINMQMNDVTDSQGLLLLKELAEHGLTEALQVIILSAFGNNERIRQAFKEFKVVDFLAKADVFPEPQKLLDSIHAATTAPGQMNLNLEISWPPQNSRAQIVRKLNLDTPAFREDKYTHDKMGAELEDLFCRLFHDAEGVRVQGLTPGWSGAGVVKIQPFYKNGGQGHELVVKFGSHQSIAEEYINFQDHVHRFISDGRNANALQQRRTVHLGGIIYTYLGAGGDLLVDFDTFYRQQTIGEIETTLEQLLTRTCEYWYVNRTALQPIKVAALYQHLFGLPPNHFEQVLNKYLLPLGVEKRARLTFAALAHGRDFTNPLTIVDPQVVYTSYRSKTHGDLNPHNMLVDKNQRIWLIDFQSTRQSHILRDIATLDAVIRFQLLFASEATLAERLVLEELLCSVDSYAQLETLASSPLLDHNESLRKAFALVIFLRKLAGQVMSSNRQAEINEYYTALFYIALNTLRFTRSLEYVQREHALLSASLLADRLKFSSARRTP